MNVTIITKRRRRARRHAAATRHPLVWAWPPGWDILPRRSYAPLWKCGAAAGRPSARAHRREPEPERGFRVANIKSQIKRNKQNEKARQRNKAVKSSLKTAVRKFRDAADSGDAEAAAVAMRVASQSLDKAASKGVIHKNQAANRKSAIAKRCAELSKS